MLDERTILFLEKVAENDSTGSTQYKQRVTKTKRNYAGEGAGLGAVLGGASGALSTKYRPAATALGAIFGAALGRAMGKRTVGKEKTTSLEGTAKKQNKIKGGDVQVPRLTPHKVLPLIEHH